MAPMPVRHLPMTRAELDARGVDAPDVVLVTGDAYVDHPSFAMAILGRWLESLGFSVAILAQPDWRSADAWRALGRPRLFYGVSAGNMDSMINHYTASRKPRSDDAYSPGGRTGLRPDRPTAVYCQRCREAFPGVPVVAGGVEASLRRVAHYDYWSDTVRPSILLTSKCDLLVHGMGERAIRAIAERLAAGEDVTQLRALPGVAYLLGASEAPPSDALELPSFEAVSARTPEGLRAFADATRMIHHETNPLNARRLRQRHGDRVVIVNPPALPLDEREMDAVYDLPYLRTPHPSYREAIPADAMIRDSVTIMRGCFGGCTFCSITTHQGRIISSRSEGSVLREVTALAASPAFKGTVSDLGGPTANMYRMRCTRPDVERVCRRLSCVHPKVCKLLGTDHGPVIDLMRKAREVKGVDRVNIASGIRMDLARRDPRYVRELAAHHVGGHLKVAPEHTDPQTLALMKKPGVEDFDVFARQFKAASVEGGKPKQYLVPYYIASHPGSTVEAMIELAVYLKRHGYRPRQVQDFIPAPMDIATCMYYTGLDPISMEPVTVARGVTDRRVQRALLQFFRPENYFEVHRALLAAGRGDLIGNGCDALIPAVPPREAIEARRAAARKADGPASGGDLDEGGYHHAPPPPRAVGYRPGRATARRKR